jgi:hypothetical protein
MSELVATLDYDCTTVGFSRQTSIALPLIDGAPGQWMPTRVFGLDITDQGTFDPGGPPGHTVFAIFSCLVDPCYYVGFAYFSLVGAITSPALAHIRVMAPSHMYGPVGEAQPGTEVDA